MRRQVCFVLFTVPVFVSATLLQELEPNSNGCNRGYCDRRCIACNGTSKFEMSCTNYVTKLYVQSAFWGRKLPYSTVCPSTSRSSAEDTQCVSPESITKLTDLCHNQTKCDLPTIIPGLVDPCPGTEKYLEIYFSCSNEDPTLLKKSECFQEGTYNRCIICQGEQMTINCSQDEVIEIGRAFYGRREPYSTYCSQTCEETKYDENCEAEDSQEQIKSICDYRSSCTLKSVNKVFGDPCVDVGKYIDVKYQCKSCRGSLCQGRQRIVQLEDEIKALLKDIKTTDKYLENDTISIKSFNYTTAFRDQKKPSLSVGEINLALDNIFNETDFVMGLSVLNVSLQEKTSFINATLPLLPPGYIDVLAVDQFPLLAVIISNLANRLTIQGAVGYTVPTPHNDTVQDVIKSKYAAQNNSSKLVCRGFKWVCAFIDFDTASFSNEGCQPTPTVVGTNMTCECNHTTIFTILLAVDAVFLPPHLKMLSYIAGGISALFLIITAITLLVVRKHVVNDRVFIQINLATTLLVFHVLNLTHDAAVLIPQLCEGLAVCLHYFLLSSVFWMLVEGITLAMKTSSKVLQFSAIKSSTINAARALVGWGIPAVITSITVVLGFVVSPPYLAPSAGSQASCGQTEAMYEQCFINYQSPFFYYTVIGPICFCAAVNLAILGHVAAFTLRLRLSTPRPHHNMSNGERLQRTMLPEVVHVAKVVLLLIPVTGAPLLLGVFVGIGSTESNMFFMYTHLTVNGLRGFFIFLVYCVMSAEVREAVSTILF